MPSSASVGLTDRVKGGGVKNLRGAAYLLVMVIIVRKVTTHYGYEGRLPRIV